ncbi:redoxin domain-containing protein [candidate division KSB1 bacterium]|nr:redoxin domain-containing protein [candidate division KSB1 bacterium]
MIIKRIVFGIIIATLLKYPSILDAQVLEKLKLEHIYEAYQRYLEDIEKLGFLNIQDSNFQESYLQSQNYLTECYSPYYYPSYYTMLSFYSRFVDPKLYKTYKRVIKNAFPQQMIPLENLLFKPASILIENKQYEQALLYISDHNLSEFQFRALKTKENIYTAQNDLHLALETRLKAERIFLGEKIPIDFQSDKWIDIYGKIIDVQDVTRKKIVLINFWTPWCDISKRKMLEIYPLLKEFQHNDQIIILHFATDSDSKTVRDFLNKHQLPGIHFADDRRIAAHFGVNEIPNFVIIDQFGRLIDKSIDGTARSLYNPCYIDGLIRQLLITPSVAIQAPRLFELEGDMEFAKDNQQRAVELYSKAITQNPHNLRVLFELIMYYGRQGDRKNILTFVKLLHHRLATMRPFLLESENAYIKYLCRSTMNILKNQNIDFDTTLFDSLSESKRNEPFKHIHISNLKRQFIPVQLDSPYLAIPVDTVRKILFLPTYIEKQKNLSIKIKHRNLKADILSSDRILDFTLLQCKELDSLRTVHFETNHTNSKIIYAFLNSKRDKLLLSLSLQNLFSSDISSKYLGSIEDRRVKSGGYILNLHGYILGLGEKKQNRLMVKSLKPIIERLRNKGYL